MNDSSRTELAEVIFDAVSTLGNGDCARYGDKELEPYVAGGVYRYNELRDTNTRHTSLRRTNVEMITQILKDRGL